MKIDHGLVGQDYKLKSNVFLFVMGMNADSNHSFPVHNIAQSINIVCFRQQRFNYLKKFYHPQQNGWMDSDGFNKWIQNWYREVKEKSDGPWLMILDNCGDHEIDFRLPGVRFEFLPPR